MRFRYGSVCTGIKAEGVAWAPLGWTPAFNAEIDPRPCAVLEHRWPTVPNIGDFTNEEKWGGLGPIDLLMGGTPCQDFSVAGPRAGLGGDRGNLTLKFLGLAGHLRPEWVVWENVPGVLSVDGGRAFGAFLGGLAKLGYGFAWRILDAQYVRVDGYPHAVPQRRRRVFVVGYLGDWRRAAAVLFERESLSGHPAPCRKPGSGVASPLTASLGGRCGVPDGGDTAGQLVAFQNSGGSTWREGVGPLASSADNGSNQVVACVIPFDTTQISSAQNYSHPKHGDPCHPLASQAHAPAIAFQERGRDGGRSLEWQENLAYSLNAISGGSRTNENNVCFGWRVRRLMPVECERLQGFPDGYTDVPYRDKPMKDGPRYFVLGNSIAANCLRWVGYRIEAVRRIAP